MTEQLPIESFPWGIKFVRFCEILEVEVNDYQNFQASQKVQQRLKELDYETLMALMFDGVEIFCGILETIDCLADRE